MKSRFETNPMWNYTVHNNTEVINYRRWSRHTNIACFLDDATNDAYIHVQQV